mgnify:CR=1 FL=1
MNPPASTRTMPVSIFTAPPLVPSQTTYSVHPVLTLTTPAERRPPQLVDGLFVGPLYSQAVASFVSSRLPQFSVAGAKRSRTALDPSSVTCPAIDRFRPGRRRSQASRTSRVAGVHAVRLEMTRYMDMELVISDGS